jgi:AraC-like DNA-binding protein
VSDDEYAIGHIATELELNGVVASEREPSYFVSLAITEGVYLQRGREELGANAWVAAVVNPGERLSFYHDDGPRATIGIRLSRGLVNRELATLLAKTVETDVRFAFALDLAEPSAAGFRDVVASTMALVTAESELLRRREVRLAQVRTLVTALLFAHEHTYTQSLRDGSPLMRPRHLARALDYIQERLSEPISLADIARACGRSERTVHAAFQTNMGVSPMTHVRNLRLERVRSALLTSEDTTSRIALDAGFTHLGRFAAAYRARFGELPSTTRARRN